MSDRDLLAALTIVVVTAILVGGDAVASQVLGLPAITLIDFAAVAGFAWAMYQVGKGPPR